MNIHDFIKALQAIAETNPGLYVENEEGHSASIEVAPESGEQGRDPDENGPVVIIS